MQDWKEENKAYEKAKSKLYWEENGLAKKFKKPKDKNAPKKPLTSYMMYSNVTQKSTR